MSSKPVTDAFHDMTVTDNCWRCTCAYHRHGNRRCKHISAVQDIVENIREAPGGTHIIGDPGHAFTPHTFPSVRQAKSAIH